jgi:hypothetical protein
MLVSFVYRAFVSLLRLLIRCGRTVDVKDIELLVLRVGFVNSGGLVFVDESAE